MAKQLNGIFRTWMSVGEQDVDGLPTIWGHCIVHLSHPELSGNVLHTSGVLRMTDHENFKLVETKNNHYALLGPELVTPTRGGIDPIAYIMKHRATPSRTDPLVSAAMNAFPDCAKCRGKGVYRRDDRHLAICNFCCQHTQGWWQLGGGYDLDKGRWACKAGCGRIVDFPPLELEFLPRAQR